MCEFTKTNYHLGTPNLLIPICHQKRLLYDCVLLTASGQWEEFHSNIAPLTFYFDHFLDMPFPRYVALTLPI